jgi:hypothetical protein
VLKFALLDCPFDGVLHRVVVPFIAKGLLGPDRGLDQELQIIMTGLAKVPVGQVEIVAPGNGLLNGLSAYITGKGFHIHSSKVGCVLPSSGQKPSLETF